MAAVALAGCGAANAPPTERATGVVIDVDSPDVAIVERFTIRTSAGDVIELAVEELSLSGGGKPAPHLREHLTSGAPVVVEYVVEADRNVAVRYYDAP